MSLTPEDRLAWARQHLDQLRREATQYLGSVRLTEDDFIIGRGATGLWVTVYPEPPSQIALMAGDTIHNMRSALDNLMWDIAPQAARTRGSNLPAFPIRDTPQAFAGTLNGTLAGFDQRIIDAVRNLQPFIARSSGGLTDRGRRLLVLLDAFWNDDKHRVPVAGVAVAGGAIPGSFHGSTAALARQAGIEVRFQAQRTAETMTVAELEETQELLIAHVIPRLRAAST